MRYWFTIPIPPQFSIWNTASNNKTKSNHNNTFQQLGYSNTKWTNIWQQPNSLAREVIYIQLAQDFICMMRIYILDWLYVLTTLSVCLYQLFQQWGSTQQTLMSESIYCNRNIFRVKKLQIHSTVLCTFCIAVCLVCSAYQKGKKLNKGGDTHFKYSTL